MHDADTIAAIATPAGRGGIGIVRVSGPAARRIAQAITRRDLAPRHAHYTAFAGGSGEPQVFDRGIALLFPAPHSLTGEDVLELQGHGGQVVLDQVLRETIRLGARLARPGEFSERAYLNDKIDLAQAEAIADLIDASSEQAARSAMQSLSGVFSDRINALIERLTQLRMYVEAAIDFPEEEIDFLTDGRIATDLQGLLHDVEAVLAAARQGSLLREGMTVVIAGRPNAGKSSLLNALAGRESAIVTAVAGTTRDVLREHILIDGMPLHIVDTAGLRETVDEVEREGVRRAWAEIGRADHLLLVVDSSDAKIAADLATAEQFWPPDAPIRWGEVPVTLILNKCDLVDRPAALQCGSPATVSLSAKTGAGIDLLREHLKTSVGFAGTGEGLFIARRRHVEALQKAHAALALGQIQLVSAAAGELLAEELRQAQQALGEITGQVTPDELLGRIFSSFCIGK